MLSIISNLFKSDKELYVENLFLRQQLIILKRQIKRVRFAKQDRAILVALSRLTSNWRDYLYIMKPDTLLRWHKKIWKLLWKFKSRFQRKRKARVSEETARLVRSMASENNTWGAKRIRGELLKVAIKLSKRTIQRLIRPVRKSHDPNRSQNWKTFLKNHAPHIWSCDFFTVTTAAFKQLYVFVILSIHTREILHWNVTEHPTAEWTYEQVLQATWDRTAPQYLICDRDGKYGTHFTENIKKRLNIKLIRTPYKAPKANSFCERLIGSMRRECLDHFLIFNEKHLRAVLAEYVSFYQDCRPHQGINQQIPANQLLEQPPAASEGRIDSRPILNGLHHHYHRQAA